MELIVSENNTNVLQNDTEPKQDDVPAEVNGAAAFFKKNMALFKENVDSLSMKELKRLVKLIVEYPLQENQQFVSVKEHHRLEEALQLIEAKSVMLHYAMELKKKEMENSNAQSQISTDQQPQG